MQFITQLAIAAGIPYIFLMLTSSMLTFRVIMLITFFYGLLQLIGIPRLICNFAIEISVLILFFLSVHRSKKRGVAFRSPGLAIFLVLFVAIFLSLISNNSGLYNSYLFARFFVTPYLLFLAISNLNMSEHEMKKSIHFIGYLFVLQIFASIIKFLYFGHPHEQIIGTIAVFGGTLSTVIPLFVIGYLAAFFLFYEKDKKYIYLAVGFCFMGWVGNKRAIWFLLPVLILFIFILHLKMTKRFRFNLTKAVIGFVIAGLVGSVSFYAGGRLIPTMNPEGRVGGSFNLSYIWRYAWQYSLHEGPEYSYGRIASFNKIISGIQMQNFDTSFLGYGTDAIKGFSRGDGRLEQFGIMGPQTGMTYHLIQIGVFGTTMLLIFYFYFGWTVFKTTVKESDPFWKAASFGTVIATVVFFLDFIGYSRTFAHNYTINFTYFFILGALFSRRNRNTEKVLPESSMVLKP